MSWKRPALWISRGLAQRCGFGVIELEDGIEARHLKRLAHDLMRAYQLELATLGADDGMAADHASDGGGINDRNAGEVDDDIVRAFGNRLAPSVAELIDGGADRKLSLNF